MITALLAFTATRQTLDKLAMNAICLVGLYFKVGNFTG